MNGVACQAVRGGHQHEVQRPRGDSARAATAPARRQRPRGDSVAQLIQSRPA